MAKEKSVRARLMQARKKWIETKATCPVCVNHASPSMMWCLPTCEHMVCADCAHPDEEGIYTCPICLKGGPMTMDIADSFGPSGQFTEKRKEAYILAATRIMGLE